MNVYDLIDEYKAGELSGADLVAFEAALATDEKLRQLVDRYDELKSVSEGILEMQLLNELSAIESEQPTKKKKLNNAHPLFYLGVVIIVALFVFYYWKFGGDDEIKKEEPVLFADVYREPIWPMTRSVTTSSLDTNISKAANEYVNRNNFPLAKKILLDSVADQNLGRYWVAEMYMQQQKFDSVLVYLPEANELSTEGDRIVLLRSWLESLTKQD